MGRPSNTDERRAQIARALLEVMAERGYDGASIAEVARAAGVAQGLVHYHFQDKREILLLAIEQLGAQQGERLAARLREAGSGPVARLEALLGAHLGLGASDPAALVCWVSMSGEALRDAGVGQAFAAVVSAQVEEIRAIVADGVASGAFRSDDPRAAAAAIGAVIQGYFMLAGSARAVIPPGSALGSARAMAGGLLGVTLAPASHPEAPDNNGAARGNPVRAPGVATKAPEPAGKGAGRGASAARGATAGVAKSVAKSVAKGVTAGATKGVTKGGSKGRGRRS